MISIKSVFTSTLSFINTERALRFEMFEKMPLISLNWFAVHQQTITCKRQNSGCFYLKFSEKPNELTTSLWNQ